MTGRTVFSAVSPENLRTIAREATSDHIQHGTELTDAVVKAASLFGRSLTSEHVRRVCEMAYHDTFERKFREKVGGMDRYISFDPPNAVEAASRLRAEKVASARPQETPRMTMTSAIEKAASAPRRFQQVNAFDEVCKSADAEDPSKVLWFNPLSELTRLRSEMKEAVTELENRHSALESSEKFASSDLFSHAVQAVKEGESVAGVLHACLGAVKVADFDINALNSVVDELTVRLGAYGCEMGATKVANLGAVNPKHPLPQQFSKLAALRHERFHVEYALDELRDDWDRVNGEIRALIQ